MKSEKQPAALRGKKPARRKAPDRGRRDLAAGFYLDRHGRMRVDLRKFDAWAKTLTAAQRRRLRAELERRAVTDRARVNRRAAPGRGGGAA